MDRILRKVLPIVLAVVLCFTGIYAGAEGLEWVCSECGAANTENFCIKCGTKKPEEIICPECGAGYAPDSGAVFCGNCGTQMQGSSYTIRYEGTGFDTPEAAVTCYMEGFKNLDFDQILGAFAWETQIEHMSAQKYLERINAYLPSVYPRMPSVNDFMASANVSALRYMQASYIYQALEVYILGEDAPDGKIITLKTPEDITAFLQKFDNGRVEKLAQMSNIRFPDPDAITDGKYSAGKNPENRAKQTAYYNADEVVNVIGMADVDDEIFLCCPTVARYGKKWYLVSVGSFLSSILGVSVNRQAFVCGKGSLSDLLR